MAKLSSLQLKTCWLEEILKKNTEAERVLDPFCGSGTTALSAIMHGYDAVTLDINPFLIWLTKAKTRVYDRNMTLTARRAAAAAVELVAENACWAEAPPIYRIERWWGDGSLEFLCRLKSAIEVATRDRVCRDLLSIAFCRTLIQISNASFNHQSMSFNAKTAMLNLEGDFEQVYLSNCPRPPQCFLESGWGGWCAAKWRHAMLETHETT